VCIRKITGSGTGKDVLQAVHEQAQAACQAVNAVLEADVSAKLG